MRAREQERLIHFAAVLLILGMAVALRVHHIDTTGVWGDQSFVLNTAMRWVNGSAIPLAANKSSVGFVNPPMIVYLYAAALRIRPDVLSVSALTMISGVVAVSVTAWVTYRVFGVRAALWAALIFAANPWSVYYSQLIWNQTMVPVFSSLTVGCLLMYFAVEQRAAYLVLSFAWAACMTQVHPSTLVQLGTIALVCALFWRRLRLWPLLAGIAVFVLLYVPFLMYEGGVGWVDLAAIRETVGQPAPFSIASVLVSLDLLRARGLSSTIETVIQFDNLATALFALSLVGGLWWGARAVPGRGRGRNPDESRRLTGLSITALWFLVPILAYLRSAHYLQVYYLIGQLPAHFVVQGFALDRAQSAVESAAKHNTGRAWRRLAVRLAPVAVALPTLALVVWQAWFSIEFQHRRLETGSGTTQVRQIREAIRAGRHLLETREDCRLVALAEGHSVELSSLSLLREFVSRERVLLADGRLALPLATPCAIYLDAQAQTTASTLLANAATPIPGTEIEAQRRIWRFFELTQEAQARVLDEIADREPLAVWSNGLALKGYERGHVGAGVTLPITLVWSFEGPSLATVYHFGTYLLTADKQMVAQSDGPGFDSIQWQKGDTFITWFGIALPPDMPAGEYQVAVALYSWPGIQRARLVSGEDLAVLEDLQFSD